MNKDRSLHLLIMAVDVFLLVLTTLAMHMALMRISPNITATTSLRYVLLCNITSYILTMAFFPPIAQKRIVKAEEIIKRCIATGVLFFVLVNLIQNLWVSQHIPVGAIAVFSLIYMTILCVERLAIRKFIKKLRSNKKNMRCIVFAGNTGTTAELYNILNTTEYGYNIQGAFYDEQRSLYPEGVKKLGGIDDIIPYLNAHNEIKEVYGYFDKADTEKLLVLSKWCDNHLIRLYYVPSTNIYGGYNGHCTTSRTTFAHPEQDYKAYIRLYHVIAVPLHHISFHIYNMCNHYKNSISGADIFQAGAKRTER